VTLSLTANCGTSLPTTPTTDKKFAAITSFLTRYIEGFGSHFQRRGVFPRRLPPRFFIMDEFRVPLLVDSNGLYITEAQMLFWINQAGGEESYTAGDPKFMEYYKNCCMYNLIYDMMDEDLSCASMYWDHAKEEVALSFPLEGKVSKKLSEITFSYDLDDSEEDEDFGIF
jgi:hypothetical protein